MVSLFGRGFESLQLHSIIHYKKSLSFSGFFCLCRHHIMNTYYTKTLQ